MTNPTLTEKDVAEIAAKLTKAQRQTLIEDTRVVRAYRPAQKLVEIGLWHESDDEYTIYPNPTDLGTRVRNHLISTPNMPKGDRA